MSIRLGGVSLDDRQSDAMGMKVLQRMGCGQRESGEFNAEKRSNQVRHWADSWTGAAAFNQPC